VKEAVGVELQVSWELTATVVVVVEAGYVEEEEEVVLQVEIGFEVVPVAGVAKIEVEIGSAFVEEA
jgi:hypothetical protein